ncbi:MAG TPA: endo alpha-1,4 polygalactosaminidase, partial [Burkholderiaceae bacterium]|nr:endo alpha-1,4 polygalactosaminidase [Burkholderiaceae bacterium]
MFVFVMGMFALGAHWPVHASPPPALRDVALFYGEQPPLDELRVFDVVVVDPDHDVDPRAYSRRNGDRSRLYAYVSVGEANPARGYFQAMKPQWFAASNPAFGTRVIDQTAPGWNEFFLDRIVAPLVERGFQGLFLDTLDSYQLLAKTDTQRAEQERAMVGLIRALRARYPELRLIFNRGFEILPEVAEHVQAVAAESLMRGWNPVTNTYRPVPETDRAWLRAKLAEAAKLTGRPSIAIDYVAPEDRVLARDTAKQIVAAGFIPWVTNASLNQLGVGRREVKPRRVLLLTDNPERVRPDVLPAQRYVAMPLNYLGYAVDVMEIDDALAPPARPVVGQYAAIVTWLSGTDTLKMTGLSDWLAQQATADVRVVMFNAPPGDLRGPAARRLGIDVEPDPGVRQLRLATRHPLAGFEITPQVAPSELYGVRLASDSGGESVVRVVDERDRAFDIAALTPWGGYAFAPYTVTQLGAVDRSSWAIQPIEFLRRALKPTLPAIDVTTENGLRLLLVHIDGDGFASRAEVPGTPYASHVMLERFVRRYRVPTTVSVIEGEVGPRGLYPEQSAALEAIARQLFAEPHVEIATHTYSHPFDWYRAMRQGDTASLDKTSADTAYNLRLPGYRFDIAREVDGSKRYIDDTLAPNAKRTRVLLWTGDCMPPPEALAQVERAGLLNMNGGMTVMQRDQASLTDVGPLGMRKGAYLQVYAPNQNENVYTNNWTGPFYGFQRVIETFEMTERPYRLKPINIYFHTYAASKAASIAALEKVYAYALSRPVLPIAASDYIRKVMDFDRAVFFTDLEDDEGVVRLRTDGHARTLRAPADAKYDVAASQGLLGHGDAADGAYLALHGDDARLVPATSRSAQAIELVRASGVVRDVARVADQLAFTLEVPSGAPQPLIEVAAFHATRCAVTVDGRASPPPT